MPSLEENRSWNAYSWPEQGDEWSKEWGGAESQWHATLWPRVFRFLPAGRVLEIAPGFGRWTRFLLGQCREYVGVDMNPACTEACEKRFASAAHARFATNDGRSLDAVPDEWIDFAFSFDSLVHAEVDVIDAYLASLSQKLAPDGVAFLHHSNLGEYRWSHQVSRALHVPAKHVPMAAKVLRMLHIAEWEHWRASSVSAGRVASGAQAAGLVCVGQEIINWGHRHSRTIDCISLVVRKGSAWDRPNVVRRNRYFMTEANSARLANGVYGFARRG